MPGSPSSVASGLHLRDFELPQLHFHFPSIAWTTYPASKGARTIFYATSKGGWTIFYATSKGAWTIYSTSKGTRTIYSTSKDAWTIFYSTFAEGR